MLQQATEEMHALHKENRERAIKAITAKNNLQQKADDLQRRVNDLQAKAEIALKSGKRDLALQILKEKQSYEASLTSIQESLQQAIEMSETVKQHIKREEEKIRQKTAEALALKVKWENAKIQQEMAKSFEGMENIDMDSTWTRVTEKINNATSEAHARTELNKGNVSAKIAELEDVEVNVAAENELAALEAKLGLGSTTNVSAPKAISTDNDLERQLAELENKIGK
jgi:phage shock protein A